MRLPHRKDNKSPFRPPDNSPFRQHFTRGSLLCNEQGKYTGFSYGCQLFFRKNAEGPARAAAGRCPAPAIFSRKNGVKALSRCGGERVLPYPFLPAAPARQKDGGRGRSAAVCLMNVLSVFIFGAGGAAHAASMLNHLCGH